MDETTIRKRTALVCTAKEASIFDLLKEYLRAKINDPIITKHTALLSIGHVCMKMGLHIIY